MEFAVLGTLRVVGERGPCDIAGAKERTLLAHLLAGANRTVSTDELIDSLWGAAPPRSAAKSLQNCVLHVRNALEPDRDGAPTVLVTDGTGYRLDVDDDAVDDRRFVRLVELARQARRADRVEAAAATLREALGLWRGPAYAGFESTRFGARESRRLEELRLAAHEERIAADLDLGLAGDTVPELESLVHEHPLREKLWYLLVLALYRSGRQADALTAYGRARDVLVEELGVDPGDELRSLHSQVLAHDPALRPRPTGPRLPAALRPAAGPFVGRDAELAALREAWGRSVLGQPVTVVLRGPPSAGRRRLAAEFATEVAGQGFAVELDPDVSVAAGDPSVPTLTVVTATPAPAIQPGSPPVPGLRLLLGGPSAAVPDAAVAVDLTRLPPDDVHAILLTYVDAAAAAEALPEALRATGGVPGRIHDHALALARRTATVRVGEGVDRAGEMQRGLDAARDSIRIGVTDFREVVKRAAGSPTDVCPWKGLATYQKEDSAWFAGRERLVAEVLTRLSPASLLVVAGASGSGKSSLLRAGLLASLEAGALPGSQGWITLVMRPGEHPMRELVRIAVRGSDPGRDRIATQLERMVFGDDSADRVVLVVDQLEEVWTACGDEGERTAFLQALADVVSSDVRCTVVVSVRADYMGELAEHAGLASAAGDATVLVGSPSEAEVRRAVEHPAERAGLVLDTGLSDAVVADGAGEPGLLPLLSTALVEIWEHREGHRLTLASYVGAGGIRGAVARIAEKAYAGLSPLDQDAARVLLLRLAGPGEGEAATRRRVPVAELSALPDPRVREVADTLARARLVSFGAGHVEVAHEALFREWPRLRAWLEEDVAARAMRGRLATAAAEWDAGGREPTELWRGARVTAAGDVMAQHPDQLTDVERDFVVAGQEAADAERRAAEARAAAATRQNRRLRFLLGGVGVLLVAALVAGTLALRASDRAEREAAVAGSRELAAATVANLETDPELSILLALEAVERSRSAGGAVLRESENALHRAMTASRVVASTSEVGGRLDWSPDGSAIVTEGAAGSGVVDVRAADTLASVRTFSGQVDDLTDVAFDHDGTLLATTAEDGTLRTWEFATGRRLDTFSGSGRVVAPVFSSDGALLAAHWPEEGFLRIHDTATGALVHEIAVTPTSEPHGLAFSPDGTRIVTTTDDAFVPVVLDLATATKLFDLPGHTIDIKDYDWSPDGRWIATSSNDFSVGISDATTGERRFTLTGHNAGVHSIDWSEDSTRLVSGSRDGTARVWEVVETGTRQLHALSSRALTDGINGVTFSPDGQTVVAGSELNDGLVTWDVGDSGDAEWANYPSSVYSGADYSPDGSALVLGDRGDTATAWDTADASPESGFGPHREFVESGYPNFQFIDVSPDGSLIATTAQDATATVWDAATLEERFTIRLLETGVDPFPWVDSVAWSADSRLLAVSSWGGEVQIVDRSGRLVTLLLPAPGFAFEGAVFSPDGRSIAVITWPQSQYVEEQHVVQVWDWAAGTVLRTLPSAAAGLAFDPRGDRLAAASADAVAEIWDPETGRRLSTLAGHTGPVLDVTYSRDGSRLATSSSDRTVRVWDATTYEPLQVLGGHSEAVNKAVFHPDGSRLTSVPACCVAREWALDLDDLVGLARAELTRGLDDEECRRYLHQERCGTTATG